MSIGSYLPSAQFMVIVGSIALSGGLVVAAQKITGTPSTSSGSLTTASQTGIERDWQSALRAIEGESIFATSSLDTKEIAKTLREAAQSQNVTDTVARTLLINLSEAKSQGLGSDIPTQDKLVDEAIAYLNLSRGSEAYTLEDITPADNSEASMKVYGNESVNTMAEHPLAAFSNVINVLGFSLQKEDSSNLAELTNIQKDYLALAKNLSTVPTPTSLRPFHLQVVNNFALMAEALDDVEALAADPLRGLAGFERYQKLNGETARVFINIAQQFAGDGILFTKDEAGSAWSSFLSL